MAELVLQVIHFYKIWAMEAMEEDLTCYKALELKLTWVNFLKSHKANWRTDWNWKWN